MEGIHVSPEREHPQRRSIRMPTYDYAGSAAYFVTVCADNKRDIFGRVKDELFLPSRLGLLVETEWLQATRRRSCVALDAYVVMPNHFHGILVIDAEGRGEAMPRPRNAHGTMGSAETIAGDPRVPLPVRTAQSRVPSAPSSACSSLPSPAAGVR